VFRPLIEPAPVYAWSMISLPRAGWLEPLRATVRALAAAQGWTTAG